MSFQRCEYLTRWLSDVRSRIVQVQSSSNTLTASVQSLVSFLSQWRLKSRGRLSANFNSIYFINLFPGTNRVQFVLCIQRSYDNQEMASTVVMSHVMLFTMLQEKVSTRQHQADGFVLIWAYFPNVFVKLQMTNNSFSASDTLKPTQAQSKLQVLGLKNKQTNPLFFFF